MDDNVIQKLELNVDGKIIELTLRQAQILKKTLGDLFGDKVIREEIHHVYSHTPYPIWYWDSYREPQYRICGTTCIDGVVSSGTICEPSFSVGTNTLNITL